MFLHLDYLNTSPERNATICFYSINNWIISKNFHSQPILPISLTHRTVFSCHFSYKNKLFFFKFQTMLDYCWHAYWIDRSNIFLDAYITDMTLFQFFMNETALSKVNKFPIGCIVKHNTIAASETCLQKQTKIKSTTTKQENETLCINWFMNK